MAPDPDRFRQVIGHVPTGVTVVTCQGPDGPAGLTTNAVASLSLEPVLLLVCFDRASRTLPAVLAARRFAVNILASGQEDLARAFASKRPPAEKFEAATHRVAHGVPVLDGSVGWLACDLRDLHDGGDHVIGVGAVTACDDGAGGDGLEPLVFHDGAYRTLDPDGSTPSRQPAAPGTR